jgi:hypothetical protein
MLPPILNRLWGAVRCVDEARMTGPQFAGDLIERRVADVTADGEKDGAVLGV